MKKTALLLVLACGLTAVFLWRSFRPTRPEIVAPSQAETRGTKNPPQPAKEFTAPVRKYVAAPKPMGEVHALPVDEDDEETQDKVPIKLERSAAAQYPREIDVCFKRRMKLLGFFDAFVEEADLTDEEIAAVKVAVYDAQSGFGEISRRVYRRPKRANWVVEAGDDAELLRRELFHNIVAIVGEERARLLPITFGTGLEVVSHRLFLKPGQPAVDLDLEETYPDRTLAFGEERR